MIEYTPAQMAAIHSLSDHTQILACAGSGKTETIAQRTAEIFRTFPDVKPEEVVAFTYSKKAAASLSSRIESKLPSELQNRMMISTIHSFCWNALKEFVPEFLDYQILDTVCSFHFFNRYQKYIGLKETGLKRSKWNYSLFQDLISQAAILMALNKPIRPEIQEAFFRYRAFIHQHNYLDYTLVIYELLEQLQHNEDLQEYFKSIRYLTVDEYQDIDPLQQEIIKVFAKGNTNICVVGDDDQTIYRFRQSNPDFMIHFANNFPNVQTIALDTNFRCPLPVIQASDQFIQQNLNRLAKANHGFSGSGNQKIAVSDYENRAEEMMGIATEIKKIKEKSPDASIAILLRKRKWITEMQTALEKIRIPFSTAGSEDLFSLPYYLCLKETADLLVTMDRVTFFNIWEDIADPATLEKAFRKLRSIILTPNKVNRLSLKSIFQLFLEFIDFFNGEDLDQRIETSELFYRILEDFDSIYGDTQLSWRLTQLQPFLENQAKDLYRYTVINENDENLLDVKILTVHQSKGLEFDYVFVPALEEGEFPTRYRRKRTAEIQESEDEIEKTLEDERRLFYVAVTRTKTKLYLSYTETKKRPSSFVTDLQRLSSKELDLNY